MKSIPLSPVDYIFTGQSAYPVEFLLYFENSLDADKLQLSLEKMSSSFWPVFGQFRVGSANSYEIVQRLEKPELKVTYLKEDLSDFSPLGLEKFSQKIESLPGHNLSAFHLYQLKKGSALVVNISHCLVDGYSYFFFLSQWAQRSVDFSIKGALFNFLARPKHSRHLLIPKNTTKNFTFNKEEFFKFTGSTFSPRSRNFTFSQCKWENLIFSKDDIKEEQLELSKRFDKRVSSNDLLCAKIVKSLNNEGKFFSNKAVVSQAFDYRRVISQIGPRYFGNAIRAVSFVLNTDQIDSLSDFDLSQKVRAATESVTEESAYRALQYTQDSRLVEGGLEVIQNVQVSDPEHGVLLTNLSRLPLDKLDFGCGPPQQVIALTPAPRSALITSDKKNFKVRVTPPVEEF